VFLFLGGYKYADDREEIIEQLRKGMLPEEIIRSYSK
jgi:hypothetical protein